MSEVLQESPVSTLKNCRFVPDNRGAARLEFEEPDKGAISFQVTLDVLEVLRREIRKAEIFLARQAH